MNIIDPLTEVILALTFIVFLYGGYRSIRYYRKLPKGPFTKILRNLGVSLIIGSLPICIWLVYLVIDRSLSFAGMAMGMLVGLSSILFFIAYIIAVGLGLRRTLKTVKSMTE